MLVRLLAFLPLAALSLRPESVLTRRVAHGSRSQAHMAVALKLNNLPKVPVPRILNPFDWSIDRPPRSVIEGETLYRQLGVAPDAPYEQIKEQVEKLLVKYENDPKKKIKVETAQDKIVELRFRQAAAGKLQRSGAVVQRSMKERGRKSMRPAVRLPGWFPANFIVTPDDKELKNAALWPLGMAALGTAVPFFAGGLTFAICLTAMNNLYQRFRPQKFTEEGMGSNMDLPNNNEFIKVIIISGTMLLLGSFTAALVNKALATPGNAVVRCAVAGVFAFVQSAFFNMYEDADVPPREPKEKKRRPRGRRPGGPGGKRGGGGGKGGKKRRTKRKGDGESGGR